MTKVLIKGLNYNDESEFEILNREVLEEKIDNIDWTEIYKATFREAEGYTFGGRAITYISAKDGSIHTYWIGQNSYNHPYDDFYEIILCKINTQMEGLNDEDILSDEELDEYKKGLDDKWDDIQEYLNIKYGENTSDADIKYREDCHIEAIADSIGIDYDNIQDQLNELYSNVIEEDQEEII